MRPVGGVEATRADPSLEVPCHRRFLQEVVHLIALYTT